MNNAIQDTLRRDNKKLMDKTQNGYSWERVEQWLDECLELDVVYDGDIGDFGYPNKKNKWFAFYDEGYALFGMAGNGIYEIFLAREDQNHRVQCLNTVKKLNRGGYSEKELKIKFIPACYKGAF